MKKLGKIIIVVLILFVTLVLARNIIIKNAISFTVKALTGLKLGIGDINVNLFGGKIDIHNLKLYNPSGFKEEFMIDLPHAYINCDLPGFLKGNIHLRELSIDLYEFVVVRNEKNELNLNSLKIVKAEKEKKEQKVSKSSRMPNLTIDLLQLKIGKVIYKDYTKQPSPQIKEYNINLDERYENITNSSDFMHLIITKALINTTIAKLANFDMDSFKTIPNSILQGATGTAAGALNAGQKVGTKATNTIKGFLEKTTEGIEKIVK